MAKDTATTPGDVFDVRKVRRLVELMHEYDLAEIDLRQADQRICLKRGGEPAVVMTSASPSPQPVPAAPPAAVPPTTDGASDANAKYIRSPIVGTYYASPSPDAAPFVKGPGAPTGWTSTAPLSRKP